MLASRRQACTRLSLRSFGLLARTLRRDTDALEEKKDVFSEVITDLCEWGFNLGRDSLACIVPQLSQRSCLPSCCWCLLAWLASRSRSICLVLRRTRILK
jgi:hypothetical protein